MNSRPKRQIDVTIEEPFQGGLSLRWVRKVIVSALDQALPSGQAAQVAVLVTGDDTMRRLNRDYRGVDEVTDVLSFSADHPGHWEGEAEPPEATGGLDFVLPPGELAPLGEVIVSYPQAQRQAEQRRAPLEHELALLVVHGVLHLTGHDHLEPAESALMQSKERTALATLNIQS